MAREIVQRRLAGAPQTRAQLDQAMVRKGVPDDVRERVLDRFAELNLIDDAAFAEAWVESRHVGRGLARRALGHELRQRGVDPTIADEAVEALPAEKEEETARQLVARRLAGTRRLEPAARMRRLLGMLARKGYAPGLAYRVVREALEAEGLDGEALPDPHLE
ncbi:regulatory protein RecX [Phytoactinopolyspora endophytica]|uniref:regulatory protein RecX n=1 Tax=Phytoactinopolyspora endophytica TaxID=1642495 RepID=UPI00197B3CC2|nr:regulatory protein RecX [Phytoactinopolyspora endophytica]